MHLAVVKTVEALTTVGGRAPNVDEIAEELGACSDDVLLAMDAGFAYRARSLDLDDAKGQPAGTERWLGKLDDAIENTGDRSDMRTAMLTLTPRQKSILMMRYFKERTQAEIGEELGIEPSARLTTTARRTGGPPRQRTATRVPLLDQQRDNVRRQPIGRRVR